MIHDPSFVDPLAGSPHRTIADDVYDTKVKAVVLINARKPKRCVPPPRSWLYKQVIPVVKNRLASNATNAVYMLNMSNLPSDAAPEQCVLWVETFLSALESLEDRDDAAAAADRAVRRSSS